MKKKFLRSLSEMEKHLGQFDEEGLFSRLKKLIENHGQESSSSSSKSGSKDFEVSVEMPAHGYALYTDGACRGNPGPGAWGVLIQDHQNKIVLEASGLDTQTTNNRMELLAVIEAALQLRDHLGQKKWEQSCLHLFSDSKYVLDGLKLWVPGWKARGWKKADKKAPENLELWQQLDELVCAHQDFHTHWVKGHSGHPQNEYVDQLANTALDEAGF